MEIDDQEEIKDRVINWTKVMDCRRLIGTWKEEVSQPPYHLMIISYVFQIKRKTDKPVQWFNRGTAKQEPEKKFQSKVTVSLRKIHLMAIWMTARYPPPSEESLKAKR